MAILPKDGFFLGIAKCCWDPASGSCKKGSNPLATSFGNQVPKLVTLVPILVRAQEAVSRCEERPRTVPSDADVHRLQEGEACQ